MDAITTGIIGSSVIGGPSMAAKSQRVRKRPENEHRKVEGTYSDNML